MKNRFVIYGGGFQWADACFKDFADREDVLVVNSQVPVVKRGLCYFFARFCYGLKKAPHVFVLPFFRRLLFKAFSQRKFLRDAENIFFIIYDQNRLDRDFSFASYLKKCYGGKIHLVYCFTNTFEKSHIETAYKKGAELYRYFDLILTYNKNDCLNYGFHYYPLMYSKSLLHVSTRDREFDCTFVGNSKERLDILHSVYKTLKSRGLRCKFYIVGVEKEQMIDAGSDIVYNQVLAYDENIALIRKSKVVLDIPQRGSSGMNLRILEALFNGAKILTNNLYLDDNVCIRRNSFVFDAPSNIDVSFFDNPFDVSSVDALSQYYSERFLTHIKDYFN